MTGLLGIHVWGSIYVVKTCGKLYHFSGRHSKDETESLNNARYDDKSYSFSWQGGTGLRRGRFKNGQKCQVLQVAFWWLWNSTFFFNHHILTCRHKPLCNGTILKGGQVMMQWTGLGRNVNTQCENCLGPYSGMRMVVKKDCKSMESGNDFLALVAGSSRANPSFCLYSALALNHFLLQELLDGSGCVDRRLSLLVWHCLNHTQTLSRWKMVGSFWRGTLPKPKSEIGHLHTSWKNSPGQIFADLPGFVGWVISHHIKETGVCTSWNGLKFV